MKLLKVPLIFLIFSLFVSCGPEPKVVPARIQFQTDFKTAKAFAEKFNQPMIIDFYTDWCRWCKTLDTLTYVDSLVRAMSIDNIFVKINAEVDTGLARQYGISGYPTIVITKPSGEEIDRIWGFMPPADFYNQVQLYLQGQETLQDYLRRVEDEPRNMAYLNTIAEKYISRSQYTEALDFYGRVIAIDSLNADGYASVALLAVADAKSRNKDFTGALDACNVILSKFPGSEDAEEAFALLGVYTSNMGDDAAALTHYRSYIEKYPNGKFIDGVMNRIADLEGKL